MQAHFDLPRVHHTRQYVTVIGVELGVPASLKPGAPAPAPDYARVGNGDAEEVSREITQNGLVALTPVVALDDPGFGPGGSARLGRLLASMALSFPRSSLAKAMCGTRKASRAGCQLRPSSEIPPPVTRQ
jgi:hypothetical protein